MKQRPTVASNGGEGLVPFPADVQGSGRGVGTWGKSILWDDADDEADHETQGGWTQRRYEEGR